MERSKIVLMTWNILLYVFLMGLALSADAFAVSVADGLIYRDINKKKELFIAGTFGVMQALMPLIGFFLVELVQVIVMSSQGSDASLEQSTRAGETMSLVVAIIACGLLLFIGGKMLIEALIEIRKPAEEKTMKTFSIKETLLFGVATSIDALATGVAFHATEEVNGQLVYTCSTPTTIFLHVSIVLVCTFIISCIGVNFGHFFEKLFKGKFEIASIIGGCILIALGIWTILNHFLGIL